MPPAPPPAPKPAPAPKPKADESAGKASGAFDKATGAAKKFATSVGKGAASAAKAFGGAVKTLASGEIPSATKAMSELGKGIGSLGAGAANKAADALDAIGDKIKGIGPAGATVAAVLGVVSTAVRAAGAAFEAVAGTIGYMMGLAIDITQKIDLMKARFAALAGSASAGKAVQDSIAKLAATLPFASSQVTAWAQSLLAAGVKGKQLEADIKAIAAATALMGESGGAAAETLFKRLGEGGPAADKLLKTFKDGGPKADKLLKEMGLSIADLGGQAALAKMNSQQLHEALAKAMQKKGAGPLAEMSLTLPVILQKAREGFLSIFAKLGPAVKPFMKAVKELFGNFNKGTPIIKSLQKIATEVFTVIFKYATIAVKAIGAVIKWFGGTKGISKAWAGVKAAFSAVISVLSIFWPILRGIVVGAVVGIMMIVAYVQSLVAAWDEFSSVIGAVGDVVSGVIDSALGAVSGFADGAIDAASSFISGLVGGISSGAGAVVDAVKNLASGALGAFKSVLGIHSPSKVMAKMGGFAAEGAAQGLDKGSDRVEASGAKLGGAMASGAAGAAGGAKGGKGSVSVTIAAGAVTIHAGGANIDEEKLAIVLERLLASQGVFA